MNDLAQVDDEEISEIIYHPKSTNDDKPIQVGQAILQNAKLLLAKFVYW